MDANANYQLSLNQLARLSQYPAAAFDAVAVDGKTVMIDKAFLKRNEEMPDIGGGWKLQWITKPPRRDSAEDELVQGRVVLFFADPRTKKIWVAGQKVLAQREGLTAEQADVWVRSKVPYKHDNLNMLVRVLGSRRETEAYLKWPGSTQAREEIDAWVKEFQIRDTMHDKRRDQVSQLVNEIVHAERANAPAINNALDAALAALDNAGNVAEAVQEESPEAGVADDIEVAGEAPAEQQA